MRDWGQEFTNKSHPKACFGTWKYCVRISLNIHLSLFRRILGESLRVVSLSLADLEGVGDFGLVILPRKQEKWAFNSVSVDSINLRSAKDTLMLSVLIFNSCCSLCR